MYDVVIIGAGPAGLSCAIYTARAGLKTVVLGVIKNSNAYRAHILENYMGFAEQISGEHLLTESVKQAKRFGAKFVEREIVDIRAEGDAKRAEGGTGHAGGGATFTVTDSDRATYTAKTLVICSGLGFKPSGIKREQELTGRGVSFCVTCDGAFFKQKKLAVIGNADFAAEEALQLLSYSPGVTILSHGKDFDFTPKLGEALKKTGVKLRKSPRVIEFIGAERLTGIKCADGAELEFDGAFMALGKATAADFANKLGIERTGPQNAYLVANPRTGETNMKGVYAAGDCTGGNAQASKSAGEGCNAAISVIKYVKGISAYVDYS